MSHCPDPLGLLNRTEPSFISATPISYDDKSGSALKRTLHCRTSFPCLFLSKPNLNLIIPSVAQMGVNTMHLLWVIFRGERTHVMLWWVFSRMVYFIYIAFYRFPFKEGTCHPVQWWIPFYHHFFPVYIHVLFPSCIASKIWLWGIKSKVFLLISLKLFLKISLYLFIFLSVYKKTTLTLYWINTSTKFCHYIQTWPDN